MPLLLIWLGKRRLFWAVVAWVLIMSWLFISVFLRGRPTIFPGIYGAHIYNAGFFLAGMIISLHSPLPMFKRASWPFVLLITSLAMIGAQYLAFYNINVALGVSPIFVLPAVCMLIAKADDSYQSPLPGTFSQLCTVTLSPLSWLERIGIMSYSVYLLHKPIGYILLQKFDPINSAAQIPKYAIELILISIPILLVCSIFYLRVENKFRRRSFRVAADT
jgi:peptidoglycan/LPS O-acetylase OafA/YrhL